MKKTEAERREIEERSKSKQKTKREIEEEVERLSRARTIFSTPWTRRCFRSGAGNTCKSKKREELSKRK